MDPPSISKTHQKTQIVLISDIGETPEERISFLKHSSIQQLDFKRMPPSQLKKVKYLISPYNDPELRVYQQFLQREIQIKDILYQPVEKICAKNIAQIKQIVLNIQKLKDQRLKNRKNALEFHLSALNSHKKYKIFDIMSQFSQFGKGKYSQFKHLFFSGNPKQNRNLQMEQEQQLLNKQYLQYQQSNSDVNKLNQKYK